MTLQEAIIQKQNAVKISQIESPSNDIVKKMLIECTTVKSEHALVKINKINRRRGK